MKKILLIIMCMFGLSSCFAFKTPSELLGEYVDINSDTRLVIKKNRLSFIYGDYHDDYKYTYSNNILSSKDGGFGHITEISVSDGMLRCEEMVLDDDGHSYIFVREDVKTEALRIKDNTKDMPKQIESSVIKKMSLHFKKDSRDVYNLGEWPNMQYAIELECDEKGEYYLEYHESGPSYVGRRYSDNVSEDFVSGLEQIIREAKVIENNGYCFENSVTGKSYSLHINYESGEEVSIKAKGDAADVCPFDLKMIMEYISEILDKQ